MALAVSCDRASHSSACRHTHTHTDTNTHTHMVRRYYTRKHGWTTLGSNRHRSVRGWVRFFAWRLSFLGYLIHMSSAKVSYILGFLTVSLDSLRTLALGSGRRPVLTAFWTFVSIYLECFIHDSAPSKSWILFGSSLHVASARSRGCWDDKKRVVYFKPWWVGKHINCLVSTLSGSKGLEPRCACGVHLPGPK